MRYKEIVRKVKSAVAGFEKQTGARLIMKSGILYGCPKDLVDRLSRNEEEANRLRNQIRASTTVGWKKEQDGIQYGNFVTIPSVAEDEPGVEKINSGDGKLDDVMVKEGIKDCLNDYNLWLEGMKNKK